jgi:hypothetical protein
VGSDLIHAANLSDRCFLAALSRPPERF